MYYVGLSLMVISALIVFGSDIFFKGGKIKDVKTLLIIKLLGFSLSVPGLYIMIKMN